MMVEIANNGGVYLAVDTAPSLVETITDLATSDDEDSMAAANCAVC